MIDLKDLLSPEAVAWTAERIIDRSDVVESGSLVEACLLHRFCLEEIGYERYQEYRSAEQVLEGKEGDCTDQTVLLASLLLSRDIPVRIVDVQDHMFPEALIPVEPGDRVNRKVGQLYGLPRNTEVRALGEPSRDSPGYWYPADSEMSRYLGDLQTHVEEELIVQQSGDWQFNDVKLCTAYKPADFEVSTKVKA